MKKEKQTQQEPSYHELFIVKGMEVMMPTFGFRHLFYLGPSGLRCNMDPVPLNKIMRFSLKSTCISLCTGTYLVQTCTTSSPISK